MKVLVSSDETGHVKEVVCLKGTDTSKKDGVKPISVSKVCLEPAASLKSRVLHMIIFEDYLITLRIDGVVCIYTLSDYTLVKYIKLTSVKPVSLINYSQFGCFIAAFENNKVFIMTVEDEPVELNLPVEDKNPTIIATFAPNPFKDGEFAFGGEENDIKLVSLFEKPNKKFMSTKFEPKIVFTAENVPNDFLDLRVPISVKHIKFLEENKFISVTKYGQLRIYDTTIKNQPIHDFKIGPKPIIQVAISEDNAILSDTTSLIGKYSLTKIDSNATRINSASAGELRRPSVKLLGKFNEGTNTGATHAIYNFENKYVATGGLDRYLRVFDIKTRKLVAKVYLGTQISSIIVVEDDEEEEDDEEDMWTQLETNTKEPEPKKLKKKSRKL
ncbi:hypothetical protein CANTEDRAFT_115213 [Yamadazyma tenuis ATCC 10573]|uniref:Ribosome biogenesis protein NSA1 n=1 Tax=Candida tenuis (strain ATCC 10573 / BCRC 21748 / CBS 615 / JCM 9827 / NBRC 10315 / NRRL Y-1498 / VKM Y-70) TaxID=590646 RepID=G3B8L9_CANTC|nr:uncharacterized protein CANTEDRAFT_115213 [Yamadazyma tenuis ATCC 10573]EGV62648.1 hypothetical protein CANTEDRAFT_115213 [Yamadazyma tenuis ATCC 10573]